mmetsp:Transcript_50875/g.58821  ORF Transcript_50875/g.58821 Transcript_50875/m.58821 type:complete len:95 (+) Transcript_50875:704-988(+)
MYDSDYLSVVYGGGTFGKSAIAPLLSSSMDQCQLYSVCSPYSCLFQDTLQRLCSRVAGPKETTRNGINNGKGQHQQSNNKKYEATTRRLVFQLF